MKYLFSTLRGLLDDFDDLFEFGNGSIAHHLVHETFAADDLGTSMSQSCESHGDFFFIDTAYAICNNVHIVAVLKEVKRGLRDADVRFDADYDARKGRIERGNAGTDFGCAVSEGCQRDQVGGTRLRLWKGMAYSMEKRVLSAWATVLIPPGASSKSSGTVSPNLALFCVVAKTGMPRI